MAHANSNFTKLPGNYLFAEIANRIDTYVKQSPDSEILRLGIGDVTRPIAPAIIKAMHAACDEMAVAGTFRGYGPDYGYDFLRDAIVAHDYKSRGIDIRADEIFISDGAKTDTACIGEVFAEDSHIAVSDPVYPVYVDTNVMAGRAGELGDDGRWSRITYLACREENGFQPQIPEGPAPDLIHLCYPNNPTGTMITRDALRAWVDYAKANHSVILYDSAYEAYISSGDVPRSIFEIPGARECAIEFRSFSKTAGFTGLRCAYTVVPDSLILDGVSIRSLWARRMSTRFNGVSYVTQQGAAAAFTPEGLSQTQETIAYYMENARIIRDGLIAAGFTVYGGVDAPYVWMKTPDGMPSWDFFDMLLNKVAVVGTPGIGFGPMGEGFFRLTAFGTRENTMAAVNRIRDAF